MDRNGNMLATVGPLLLAYSVELSHDGSKAALGVADVRSEGYDIWVRTLDRGTAMKINGGDGNAHSPVWSPDDRHLFFGLASQTQSGRVYKIVSKSADGVGLPQTIYSVPEGHFAVPTSIAGDGSCLIMMIREGSGRAGRVRPQTDVGVLPLAGQAPVFRSGQESSELNGQLAPATRARWLAYESDESGNSEVYVQRLDREPVRFRISTAGGSHPRWGRDGRELFYLSPERRLIAVEIVLEPQFSAGIPRPLFEPKIRESRPFQYDVAPDGRFLVLRTVVSDYEPVTLIQNWTKELVSK